MSENAPEFHVEILWLSPPPGSVPQSLVYVLGICVCVCACAAFLFHLVFISISPFRFHVPGSIVFAPLVFTSASFSFAFAHVVFMIGFSGPGPSGYSIPGRIVVAPFGAYVVVALFSRRICVVFAFFVASPF